LGLAKNTMAAQAEHFKKMVELEQENKELKEMNEIIKNNAPSLKHILDKILESGDPNLIIPEDKIEIIKALEPKYLDIKNSMEERGTILFKVEEMFIDGISKYFDFVAKSTKVPIFDDKTLEQIFGIYINPEEKEKELSIKNFIHASFNIEKDRFIYYGNWINKLGDMWKKQHDIVELMDKAEVTIQSQYLKQKVKSLIFPISKDLLEIEGSIKFEDSTGKVIKIPKNIDELQKFIDEEMSVQDIPTFLVSILKKDNYRNDHLVDLLLNLIEILPKEEQLRFPKEKAKLSLNFDEYYADVFKHLNLLVKARKEKTAGLTDQFMDSVEKVANDVIKIEPEISQPNVINMLFELDAEDNMKKVLEFLQKKYSDREDEWREIILDILKLSNYKGELSFEKFLDSIEEEGYQKTAQKIAASSAGADKPPLPNWIPGIVIEEPKVPKKKEVVPISEPIIEIITETTRPSEIQWIERIRELESKLRIRKSRIDKLEKRLATKTAKKSKEIEDLEIEKIDAKNIELLLTKSNENLEKYKDIELELEDRKITTISSPEDITKRPKFPIRVGLPSPIPSPITEPSGAMRTIKVKDTKTLSPLFRPALPMKEQTMIFPEPMEPIYEPIIYKTPIPWAEITNPYETSTLPNYHYMSTHSNNLSFAVEKNWESGARISLYYIIALTYYERLYKLLNHYKKTPEFRNLWLTIEDDYWILKDHINYQKDVQNTNNKLIKGHSVNAGGIEMNNQLGTAINAISKYSQETNMMWDHVENVENIKKSGPSDYNFLLYDYKDLIHIMDKKLEQLMVNLDGIHLQTFSPFMDLWGILDQYIFKSSYAYNWALGEQQSGVFSNPEVDSKYNQYKGMLSKEDGTPEGINILTIERGVEEFRNLIKKIESELLSLITTIPYSTNRDEIERRILSFRTKKASIDDRYNNDIVYLKKVANMLQPYSSEESEELKIITNKTEHIFNSLYNRVLNFNEILDEISTLVTIGIGTPPIVMSRKKGIYPRSVHTYLGKVESPSIIDYNYSDVEDIIPIDPSNFPPPLDPEAYTFLTSMFIVPKMAENMPPLEEKYYSPLKSALFSLKETQKISKAIGAYITRRTGNLAYLIIEFIESIFSDIVEYIKKEKATDAETIKAYLRWLSRLSQRIIYYPYRDWILRRVNDDFAYEDEVNKKFYLFDKNYDNYLYELVAQWNEIVNEQPSIHYDIMSFLEYSLKSDNPIMVIVYYILNSWFISPEHIERVKKIQMMDWSIVFGIYKLVNYILYNFGLPYFHIYTGDYTYPFWFPPGIEPNLGTSIAWKHIVISPFPKSFVDLLDKGEQYLIYHLERDKDVIVKYGDSISSIYKFFNYDMDDPVRYEHNYTTLFKELSGIERKIEIEPVKTRVSELLSDIGALRLLGLT